MKRPYALLVTNLVLATVCAICLIASQWNFVTSFWTPRKAGVQGEPLVSSAQSIRHEAHLQRARAVDQERAQELISQLSDQLVQHYRTIAEVGTQLAEGAAAKVAEDAKQRASYDGLYRRIARELQTQLKHDVNPETIRDIAVLLTNTFPFVIPSTNPPAEQRSELTEEQFFEAEW